MPRLNAAGEHDALHPRNYGRLGERDEQVLARCLEESRTMVTENARDFRKLVGATELHPGLIIMPSVSHQQAEALLDGALVEIASRGDPASVMINSVVEVNESGEITFYELPAL